MATSSVMHVHDPLNIPEFYKKTIISCTCVARIVYGIVFENAEAEATLLGGENQDSDRIADAIFFAEQSAETDTDEAFNSILGDIDAVKPDTTHNSSNTRTCTCKCTRIYIYSYACT